MNERLIAHLVSIAANLFLGIALMTGGAFLARRSVASGAWAALAGFAVVSADILRSWARPIMIRDHLPALYVYMPISLLEAVVSTGALMLAIHSLPPRFSWTR